MRERADERKDCLLVSARRREEMMKIMTSTLFWFIGITILFSSLGTTGMDESLLLLWTFENSQLLVLLK